MNFYVFLPLLARGSSSISTPPDTSNDGFHYGVLDPQGIIGVGTDFANWINSVRAYGMNDGFVYNDNPDLSVSDALGFNVLTSPMFQMYREWYYYENYHNGAPLCGGTLTMACAEAQIGPIVDALKGHSSLVGYDTIDDTSSSMKVRVWYVNQIFHAHDTLHPEGPTLIGTAYQDVYDYSRPYNFIVYDYPARQGYAPCDFYRGSSQNWVDNLRFAMQLKPSTVPLIEILQTHATSNWLRYPTVEELRLNYWLALGEGAKGLYWFTWSTIPGDYWMGLSKNTTLLPEAADLVSRTTKLRPYLAPIHKIADAFQVSAPGKSYISTLKNDATGILYVIAANHECAAQTLTLSSWNYNAQIKDLETGQIYNLPASISFRGGDGKLFQVVNPVSLTPPTPQANLILNSSFEQSSNDTWPDNWSTPIVGSGGSTGTVTWDSTVSHIGSHSIKFVGSTNNGPYFSQTPSLKAGTRYYLSYWVKGQNLALTNNLLGIRLIETGATCCGVFIDAWWNQSGAFDWQKHIAFFRVPADYTQGRLDIVWNLQAGTTAWLDDVTLCQVDLPCPDTYLGNR